MLALFLAAVAGLSLGLLGGGGSILTVPILIYAAGMPTKSAVAMSLAVVGIATIFGVLGHHKSGNISYKTAFIFILTAIPSTFIGSYLSQFISGNMQLIIFSIVMIMAASFMLKGRKEVNAEQMKTSYPLTLLSGFVVGTMTGLIGVGGGFLIVPSLMYFTGTDMKKSVGTSLFIISINSLFGFISYIGKVEIDWIFMLKFTLSSILGILIGSKLVKFIPQKLLKKAFAIFLIVMGNFIFIKNYSGI